MNKQFYYTRKEPVHPKEGDTGLVFREFKDSFNPSKVIRTIEMDNGGVLVLLDDIHQRKQEVPIRNKKGQQTGIKNEVNAFQSEINLSKEDGERYYNLVNLVE